MTSEGIDRDNVKLVFKAIIPFKYRVFLCLAYIGRLNTLDNMAALLPALIWPVLVSGGD
jgi:hypothetical protein